MTDIFKKLYYSLLPWTGLGKNPHNTNHNFNNKKNKNRTMEYLLSQIIFLVILFVNDLNWKGGLRVSRVLNMFICLINVLFFFFSHRFTSSFSKLYYNLFIAIYGTIVLYADQINPLVAWTESQVLPFLSLSLTHCKRWFIIHSVIQLIYLKSFFAAPMINTVIELSPQEFVRKMIYGSVILVLMRVTLVFAMSSSVQEMTKQNFSQENEEKELQKQKDFLLGFSHEFRNLTHSVVGNIKLASFEEIPQKIRTLLLRAEISGELLLQYINNILDSGKLEVNELEITPTLTRVYDILEQVWRVSSEMLKSKGLIGSIKISKNVPSTLYIDHYRILQILFNLITNAIKFTDRGSVTVTIDWINAVDKVDDSCFEPVPFNDDNEYDEGLFEKTQAFTIFDQNLLVLDFNNSQISSRVPSDKTNSGKKGVLKVTVRDTGCGILSSNIPKLWDIFWKPTRDSTGRKYGTGLGLFITKHLCKIMGGDIKVYTKAGRGSSFVFCIPTKSTWRQRQAEVDFETLKTSIYSKNLKAMVVDDVEFNNLIIKNFFEKLNIEVVQMAEDGLDALSKYIRQAQGSKKLQVVTMDIDMPNMNGKTAAQKIREYEVTNNLQPCILIMVSGDCSESDIKECTAKDGKIYADGFLKKPANMEELVRVIGNALLQ